MSNHVDIETLEALRVGNHQAFEKVFITYFNRMRTFIDGYIKSEEEAEELAADVFVNLWTNHQAINPEKSFNAYMHTLARNSAINFLKQKYVRDVYAAQLEDSDTSHTSEDDLIAKETALLIEMTVEKMPDQRKKIYRLSRQEGLSNEEIAIQLNTTKRNVESQLSLALKDIRKVVMTFLLMLP